MTLYERAEILSRCTTCKHNDIGTGIDPEIACTSLTCLACGEWKDYCNYEVNPNFPKNTLNRIERLRKKILEEGAE